jgi:photosystem II stability/assembly factor-like uncharacterized protein
MKAVRWIGAALGVALLAVVVIEIGGNGRISGPSRLQLPKEEEEKDRKEEGHAWEAFEWWYGTRAYPFELLPKAAYFDAYRYSRENLMPAGTRDAMTEWRSIGPDNVGGRVLSLAVDPGNPSVLWCGAASGGLWRSTTAGEGAAAWTRIETGFPSLSVSAIVIDPNDTQVMYIGTGEMSRYLRPQVGTPGARSSYGLGILKSVDGGVTWQETGLTWTFDVSRAVLALKMDPTDSNVLWAATSEGLYKTTDAGTNWTLSHASLMAMDVVVDPYNPQKVWVSHGQLNSTPDPGIYRTTDGGASWTQLGGGLPTANFGRTPLALHVDSPVSPRILYAGVSDASSRQIIGLFKSTNEGTTWTNVNSTNWTSSQAWYDNVVGVSPLNSNIVFCGGLDWYRSTNGGTTLPQITLWYLGYEGEVPPGGPEGPSNYVHADQHAIVWDPTNPQIVYVGSDGGVFKSTDGGVHWGGKNGGFVTTQFYAGFANGTATASLALGGLQDNGTVKYTGSPTWSKVFGGDGGWCAIDPSNENVLYEEYVYLNMYKSTDGGSSWSEVHGGNSNEANFIAPFVICETNPNILYAGQRAVQKSTNGGGSWSFPDGNSNWNGTPMAVIGVSFTSPDTLLAGTGSGNTGAVFEIRRSTNGGLNWTNVTAGLPQRYPTDITYERGNSLNAWLTFSGYGTPHVYKSTDAGLTWADRSGNLPDIPVQSIAVDPIDPNWVYVGTDLGIYRTIDGGLSWTDYNQGMPIAMVLDVVIRPQDRIMRAATFGNGIYEIDLPQTSDAPEALAAAGFELGASPNPLRDATTIRFALAKGADVRLEIYDLAGRRVRSLADGARRVGPGEVVWNGRDDRGSRVAGGVYFARLAVGGKVATTKITVME